MGAEAHQPGDELTEHETRDLDDWLARMTQAMAHERECMERRLVPPDPRLTDSKPEIQRGRSGTQQQGASRRA